jgi:hypothetical protein
MDLRSTVFQALRDDTGLHGLGLSAGTVYLNNAVDSPVAERFMVLRWGGEQPVMGAQTSPMSRDLDLWVYDQDNTYEAVRAILKRAGAVLSSLTGISTGSGWIIDCRWAGNGDDGWDDVYERVYRNATYTIVGTGD